MASSKRIGFFWGEEKITLAEFEKNAPLRVITAPLGPKTNTASPFSSNFTEEIQVIAILQKMLHDNQITGASFYVSLPMKEIVLRSFVIPFVKLEDIQNVIKFEAKKYLPFDIQELTFVFHTIPFTENKIKRLQVIFFAVRKEAMARYERIFKQANAVVTYCEPYMVSMTKVLLFKKEINPADQLAFLILDKNLGRICFIDKGIPQFIREFSLIPHSSLEEAKVSPEVLNLKIVNEVGNSFDFYVRQFGGDRMEQMLILSETVDRDLFNILETELRIKVRTVSPVVTMGAVGQSNDMDTICAMGACVEPPMESLSAFNFLSDKFPKSNVEEGLIGTLKSYKESIFVFLICMVCLFGAYTFFQVKLKVDQKQYDQLFAQQGGVLNEPLESIQAGLKDNTDKLAAYKNIRTESDVALVLLRVASHLPQGALLKALSVNYDQNDSNNMHVTIDMTGDVLGEDPDQQIAVVNQIFSDFKNDKELSRFIKKVNLVSLNREELNGKEVTGFNIHCS